MKKIKQLLNYKYWLKRFRHSKAYKKWTKDFNSIKIIADKTDRSFYWYQLVRQEIWMFIQIGEQVSLTEFNCLCDRRGFNFEEQNYLQAMLKYIGLWKIKKEN